MIELASGWSLSVEESTAHHWVATCRDVVLVFAYEGSHDDVQHVRAAARAIERLAAQRKAPVKMLFVVPPRHAKPPGASVRSAIIDSARRLESQIARASIVVSGTGFGAAVHRGATTSLLAIFRPKFPVRVDATVSDGLASLLDRNGAGFAALLRACEDRTLGPATERAPG